MYVDAPNENFLAACCLAHRTAPCAARIMAPHCARGDGDETGKRSESEVRSLGADSRRSRHDDRWFWLGRLDDPRHLRGDDRRGASDDTGGDLRRPVRHAAERSEAEGIEGDKFLGK